MRKLRFAGLILVLAAAVSGAAPARTIPAPNPGDPPLARLESQLAAILKTSPGTIGVAIKHLESGRGLALNGDTPLPMASVVKVPILVEVLAQVREGRFGLGDEWTVQPADQFYDGSLLSDLEAPGLKLTTANLINLMMWLSDNTATDMLLTRVGIPAVNARLRAIGIDGITVDRTIRELLLDYEVGESAPYRNLGPAAFAKVYEGLAAENPAALEAAERDFPKKPADKATALAMRALLEKIFRREILDPAGCALILKVMGGCQTGGRRIKGLLPAGTPVAHKTGTIGGTINDCGIIDLPDGLGHVAVCFLSAGTDPDRTEDIIALVAKTAYDFFCFAL